MAAFDKLQGLNRPIWYQFWVYLDHLLHGNLGFSYIQNASVAVAVRPALPEDDPATEPGDHRRYSHRHSSRDLQAVRRNKVDDYVLTGTSFVFTRSRRSGWALSSLRFSPSAFISCRLRHPRGRRIAQILSDWQGLILPVMTLALVSIAAFSRYMRSSMIDSLAQDYIRTAKAKGLSQRAILFRHALRNSLIPMATLIGLSIPFVLQRGRDNRGSVQLPGGRPPVRAVG